MNHPSETPPNIPQGDKKPNGSWNKGNILKGLGVAILIIGLTFLIRNSDRFFASPEEKQTISDFKNIFNNLNIEGNTMELNSKSELKSEMGKIIEDYLNKIEKLNSDFEQKINGPLLKTQVIAYAEDFEDIENIKTFIEGYKELEVITNNFFTEYYRLNVEVNTAIKNAEAKSGETFLKEFAKGFSEGMEETTTGIRKLQETILNYYKTEITIAEFGLKNHAQLSIENGEVVFEEEAVQQEYEALLEKTLKVEEEFDEALDTYLTTSTEDVEKARELLETY